MINQTTYNAPGIPSLGMNPYCWHVPITHYTSHITCA